MDNNRGSQFRKWDLHYHSHKTVLNNQFNSENSYEEYFTNIESSDVYAYGITDYFKFENIENTITLFKEKYPGSNKVLFPNIEFRLPQNVSNNSSGHVNFHLIFDPHSDFSKIQDFVNSLELTQSNPNGTKKRIVDLIRDSDFYSATIELTEINKKLKSTFGIEKPYLKVFAANGLGGIRANITGDIGSHRNGILSDECDKEADFFFSDIQSRDYYLDKLDRRYVNSIPKACVLASDFHGDNSQNQTEKNTWIKADVTFEGLKQIKFEPEDRVFIGHEKPHLEKDELVIDKVVYNGNSIYLSENLNSIIGGRATGKSTLLNSFAKKLGQEIIGNSLPIDEFKIIWRDKIENYQRQIEYIPQEYMFKLTNDEKSLNQLVDKIIKSKKIDEKIEEYNVGCRNVQSEIQSMLHVYFEMLEKLENLQKPEAEKEATNKRIEEYINRRQEILSKNDFSEDEKKLFQDHQKKKELHAKQKTDAEIQKNLLDTLQIQEFKLIDNTNGLNEDLKERLNLFISKINEDAIEKFEKEIVEISSSLDDRIINDTTKISEIENDDIYRRGLSISQTNTELVKLDGLLKTEDYALDAIMNYDKQKTQLEADINKQKKYIVTKYRSYKKLRDLLEDNFKIVEIDLELKIEFKQKNLYDEFSYVNGQGNSKTKFIEKLQENFEVEVKNIFNQKDLKYNNNKTSKDLIENFFTTHFYDYDFKIIYQNDEFKQMSPGKKAFVILKLILEFSDSKIPVLIDQPEDSLDNRAIYNELTKYIRETKQKRQIIIVTHNPNVVVGSDCENIIVANQNSNNSKNKNGVKFDYINGPLENSFTNSSSFVLAKQGIREHIFEILEGGREAFEKREQKYNVNSIRL